MNDEMTHEQRKLPARERWLVDGEVWENVHPVSRNCFLNGCVIHNPSVHPMRDWPMELHPSTLVLRVCPEHEVGHPDPDSVAYFNRMGVQSVLFIIATHDDFGCCGCCKKES